MKKLVRQGVSKIDYSKFDPYFLRILIDEGCSISEIAQDIKQKESTTRSILAHFNLKTQLAMLLDAIKPEELSQNPVLMNKIGKILSSIKTRGKGEQILYNLNNICSANSEHKQSPNRETVENCIKKYGVSMEKIENLKNVSQSRYKARIEKICKELGISEDTLMELVGKYNIE